MMEEKPWYNSKTIWGALIAVGASLSGFMGLALDPVTQSDLADALLQLVGGIGAIVAIYGRLMATDRIV